MAVDGALYAWEAWEWRPGKSTSPPNFHQDRNDHPLLAFGDAATEDAVFAGLMPLHYEGLNFTVRYDWVADTATTGNVVWGFRMERWENEVFDVDGDDFVNLGSSAKTTAAGAAGHINNDTRGLTQATVGILAGEPFLLKIERVGGSGSDTMSGDAHLLGLQLHENT